MNKILLIIQREYLTRVKKKSFLVMTILGPMLMALVYIIPIWLAMRDQGMETVQVVDDSHIFTDTLKETNSLKFVYSENDLQQTLTDFQKEDYSALLYIPHNILDSKSVKFFYKDQPGVEIESHVRENIEEIIYNHKLKANKIDLNIIRNSETTIKVITEKLNEDGTSERSNTGLKMLIGMAFGIVIYMFVLLYGVQVMRGVVEEKTNRIVEVIISSVRPFQLMMGKIVGIALVGLTQFLLWVFLTMGIFSFAQATLLKGANKELEQHKAAKELVHEKGADLETLKDASPASRYGKVYDMVDSLNSIDFTVIFMCFLFYFIGGYLFYGALFAAVGSVVDSETDTQQFMLPITIPLIASVIMSTSIMRDPNGPIAFWSSIIPFTSPITMMVRLPFGVPPWQLVLSMGLLVFGFIFTVWLAGRIYRTGILMYGKKPTYKELWKWLFYKG